MENKKPVVTLTVGNPGQEESACIDVLRQGFCTDAGKLIQEELDEVQDSVYDSKRYVQDGYREDMIKYKKQVERYKNENIDK